MTDQLDDSTPATTTIAIMPDMEKELGTHEVGIYVSEDNSIHSEEEVHSETIRSDEEEGVTAHSGSGGFEAGYSDEDTPTFRISGEDQDETLQPIALVTDADERTIPMILHPGKQGGRRRSSAVFIAGNREQEEARALFVLGEVKRANQHPLIVGNMVDHTESLTSIVSGEDQLGSLPPTTFVTDEEEHTVPMILHPGRQGGRRKSSAVFVGSREHEQARALFVLGEVKRAKKQHARLIVTSREENEQAPTLIVSEEERTESQEPTKSVTDEDEHTIPMILHPGKQGGRRRSSAVFIGNREQEKARALFRLGEVKRARQQQATLIVDNGNEVEEPPVIIASSEDSSETHQPSVSVSDEDEPDARMVLHPGRQRGRRQSTAVVISGREEEQLPTFQLGEITPAEQVSTTLLTDDGEEETTPTLLVSEHK